MSDPESGRVKGLKETGHFVGSVKGSVYCITKPNQEQFLQPQCLHKIAKISNYFPS